LVRWLITSIGDPNRVPSPLDDEEQPEVQALRPTATVVLAPRLRDGGVLRRHVGRLLSWAAR
jgi:hypothetical protein